MKLLRDAARGGRTAVSEEEFQLLIRLKLMEEASEVTTAKPATLLEELADLMEVFREFIKSNGITMTQVDAARKAKAEIRGRFRDRVVSV